MTPVHYVAQNGYANIVRLLEQHGADIDAVTDCGRSVFMLAAENGHKDDLKRELIKYTKRKTR